MTLIGKNLKIRVDRVDAIIRLIGYITLNLIPLSKFIELLEKEVGLSPEKSREVARKIDEIIFSKIREEVKRKKQSNFDDYEGVKIKKADNDSEGEALISDMKEHASRFAGGNKEKTLSDVLKENKTEIVKSDGLDPYREPLE